MNFAIQANISPSSALFTEGANSPYANILSVRKGDENRPEIQKLLKALQSDDVKRILEIRIQRKYRSGILINNKTSKSIIVISRFLIYSHM